MTITSPRADRPTLEQVAAHAGVSMTTASKVLNGRPRVSDETRGRVERAIQELGYVPTTGPRPTAAPTRIAVVFARLSDIYQVRVLEGVLAVASRMGVEVVTSSVYEFAGAQAPLSPAWLRQQVQHQTAGIVLVTGEVSASEQDLMRTLGIPAVHIDPLNPLGSEIISVSATNFTGGTQATNHLIGLGHRRIAFAGGDQRSLASRERQYGYLSALSAAGIEPDPAHVLAEDFAFEAGLDMGMRLLTGAERPTAIFAACDATALGVLEAARRCGLRVPQDLSVVGFDDTFVAATTAPALTTVRQPVIEMGRQALQMLLQQVRGEPIDTPHVQLATQLIVRDSTAPPGIDVSEGSP